MVDDPSDLRRAEIRIHHKPCLLAYHISVLLADHIGFPCRPLILPYDCIIDRHSRHIIPQHHGLPLIVKADTGNLFHIDIGLLCRHIYGFQYLLPDLHRIMLYPSRLREMLCVLLISP